MLVVIFLLHIEQTLFLINLAEVQLPFDVVGLPFHHLLSVSASFGVILMIGKSLCDAQATWRGAWSGLRIDFGWRVVACG